MPAGKVPGSERKCGKCGTKGHRSDHCTEGKAPKAKRAAAPSNGHKPAGDLAAAIRALKDTAEAGKRAQAELDEIEVLLAAHP